MPIMQHADFTRNLMLSVFGLFGLQVNAAELKVPDDVPVERFDFEQQGVEAWLNGTLGR